MSNPVLDAARDKRARLQSKLDLLLVEPTTESRSLTDGEVAEFEELAAKITKLDGQIDMLAAEESRKAVATAAVAEIDTPTVGGAVVTNEPATYSKNSRNSYLYDLAAITVPQAGLDVRAAQERLERHGKEVEVEARKNADLAYRLQFANREKRANITGIDTVNGYGGDLVPPMYLIDAYVPFFRSGRVFANRVTNAPLPAGTDSINVPKLATGLVTAMQGAASTNSIAGVNDSQFTTGNVSASVNTLAGQTEVSLQLIEQSPVGVGIDGVVFQDLLGTYNQVLDQQVLYGSGTSGQHQGVITYAQASGVNAISAPAYGVPGYVPSSDAKFFGNAGNGTSQAGSQFNSIVAAANYVETQRFANPTAIWVHPRRANSWAVGGDASTYGRPLFVKEGYGPFNALGTDGNPQFEGVTGELFGLPVVRDANFPTNFSASAWTTATNFTGTGGSAAGTGGSADAAIVLKEDDLYLWEGPLRLRALPEVVSGNLAVRYQAYAYSAFMPNRIGAAIAIAGGVGFQVPTF